MLLLFYSGHFIDRINTSWNTIDIKCDFFSFYKLDYMDCAALFIFYTVDEQRENGSISGWDFIFSLHQNAL